MSDLTDPDKPKVVAKSALPVAPSPDPTPPALPVTPEANALINALLTSKDHSQKALELIGFPGPVDKCGNVRLYLKLDLGACFQFSAASILYAEPPDPKDPTHRTKIVVDGSTNVEIVLNLETAFLEGSIAATHKLSDIKRFAISLF